MSTASFLGRLDAEHRAALEAVPDGLYDLNDIGAARSLFAQVAAQIAAASADHPGVSAVDQVVPGGARAPEVMVRLYRPEGLHDPAPALFYMHGGGLVRGSVSESDLWCRATARAAGCAVASVEYRLAPEHPHPAPIEDCYAGLSWLAGRAGQLGLDLNRIAVGGGSAGGGLAAALALLARDRGEVQLAFQWLLYPMLDDRSDTASSHRVTHPKVWNRAANIAAWKALLGETYGTDSVSPHAAAARADDLAGLPPAYIAVGEFDLFVDEDVDYAVRLIGAGVPTELHVYPGAFHGSDVRVPGSALSRRITADSQDALHRVLHVDQDVG